LPAKKAEVYTGYAEQLESAYLMFSVALNEALELRRLGSTAKSCQALYVIPELCKRLVHTVGAILRALSEHSRHHGTIPNANALSPSNFQGSRAQRTARMNELLSRVLLTQRSQFLHKISAIEEMTGQLEGDFCCAAEGIGLSVSLEPDAEWRVVDIAHYDLNTCLRETVILLKSFLVTLPEDQLGAFQKTVQTQMRANRVSGVSRQTVYLPAKRLAAGGGR
jgi:hypothetical protein